MLILLLFVRTSYTDIKNRKIEKGVTVLLALLCFIYHGNPQDSAAGALILSGGVEMVNLLVAHLKGIGGGDIRLFFDMGLLLGMNLGLDALLLCLILALLYWFVGKKVPLRNENRQSSHTEKLPMAPFISFSAVLFMLVG